MELDLAIMLDCTGSMGGTIDNLRRDLRNIVQKLCASSKCSIIRTALIRFRDHPPQDETFITQVMDFSSDAAIVQTYLDESEANGGGDGPEAIACAMYDAVTNLSWNSDSKKVAILCTDTLPHGVGSHTGDCDGFAEGCPLGRDPVVIAHQMAERSITLLALCTSHSSTLFLAGMCFITGGRLVRYSDSISNFTELMVGLILEDFDIEEEMTRIHNELASEAAAMGTTIDEEELTRRMTRLTSGHPSRFEFPGEETYCDTTNLTETLEDYLKMKSLSEALCYIDSKHSHRGGKKPLFVKSITKTAKKMKRTKKVIKVKPPKAIRISKNPMKPKIIGVRRSLRIALRNALLNSKHGGDEGVRATSDKESKDAADPTTIIHTDVTNGDDEINQELRRLVRKAIARKEFDKTK